MRSNTQRLGLLLVSFLLIGIAVVACASPQGTTTNNSGSSGGGIILQTPANMLSPTPAFPGFTVGAWPSNYSPGNNDTVTIYVICRKQDPSMQTPPTPVGGVGISVQFAPAGNAQVNIAPQNSQTGPDGIAAFTVQFNDPTSGVPIVVKVFATFNGITYVAQTFFTPNPGQQPSPTGGACAKNGGAGCPTPTP